MRCRLRSRSASRWSSSTTTSTWLPRRFDAATFAIYAIGCLQIPLVDLIVTSTVNVLMVKMADAPRGDAALALWHDTVSRLAFLIFPLALSARRRRSST